MSRIRFMSPYLKGGRNAAKLANRTRYVATRPGVEVLPEEHGDRPATKKQQEYIRRLLRDFPDAQELLEYEDYQSNPARETASVFIQQVREDFVEAMSQRENYLDYVAHRPRRRTPGESTASGDREARCRTSPKRFGRWRITQEMCGRRWSPSAGRTRSG